MLPLVGVPPLAAKGLAPYRKIFCREAGFEHVSRYVTGLLLSPHKTLQGIYAHQVWPDTGAVSRRAMHAAVFEAGWDSAQWMRQQRATVAAYHRGRGLEVIGLDWTYAHHERGPAIYAVKRAYDHVQACMSRYQTVVTAVVANREMIEGIAVEVQFPNSQAEEFAYLTMTAQDEYRAMDAARQRLLELLHYHKNRLAYRKRTAIALEIVRQLESEGQFPHLPYAFDNGVLSRPLTQVIEQQGKHWVSELESSRLIQWQGQWQRLADIAAGLRGQYPQSFRALTVTVRSGQEKLFWVFTKTVRLKRYGRKRLVIVHEQADLSDAPRFLRTDALQWEGGRVIRLWSYRWASELFHEFCKQVTGLEAAQVRTPEAVTRHFRLSCVAQSLRQRAPCGGRTVERFAFAEAQPTLGQRLYTLTRETLGQLLQMLQHLFAQGQRCEQILERLMPA